MKNFLTLGFLFALLAVILTECSHSADHILTDNTHGNERVVASENKTRREGFIDLEEAKLISNQFLNWNPDGQLKSSGKDRTLKKSSVIKLGKNKNKNGRGNNESDTLMYVLNYTDGFTIVSATNKIYPILAYSDEGTSFDENDTTNIGPIIWLENMEDYIENVIEDTTVTTSMSDIYSSLPFTGNKNPDATLRAAVYIDEIRNYKKIGPLLTTESWHQDFPYNIYSPYRDGVQAPTGCVPLAIAQVVNYYKTLNGENINWTAINNGNANAIANLIHTIANGIGMTYEKGYAYPNLCFPDIFCYHGRIENYLKSKGYSAGFTDLIYGSTEPCPSIFEGFTKNFIGTTNWFGGHWWVMDGYEKYDVYKGWFDTALPHQPSPPQPRSSISPKNTELQKALPGIPSPGEGVIYGILFMHFNWGWGGKSNAWYGINDSYLDYCKSFKKLNLYKK